MSQIQFDNEEQLQKFFREIEDECNFMDCLDMECHECRVEIAKKLGYIKKSEFQEKVEEMEKRYKAYEKEGVVFTPLEQLGHEAIQLLKQKYPEDFK